MIGIIIYNMLMIAFIILGMFLANIPFTAIIFLIGAKWWSILTKESDEA